jgi:hypothetical protein
VYCKDNPVIRIDFDGRDDRPYYAMAGQARVELTNFKGNIQLLGDNVNNYILKYGPNVLDWLSTGLNIASMGYPQLILPSIAVKIESIALKVKSTKYKMGDIVGDGANIVISFINPVSGETVDIVVDNVSAHFGDIESYLDLLFNKKREEEEQKKKEEDERTEEEEKRNNENDE